MSDRFVVSASPHIHHPLDTAATMRLVCLALAPAAISSAYFFGPRALLVILLSVASCLATEALSNRILGKLSTLGDGSAVVTGLLLAFTLPATTPWWLVVIGGFFAIFVVKQLFGGLGYNIFNPALAARALLQLSAPTEMMTWMQPVQSFTTMNGVTGATPLGILKETPGAVLPSYIDLFLGRIPGSLGETCKLALLIGAVLLLATKVVDWRIPTAYIGMVALLSAPMGRDPLREVLSGGLILGAFFMATDLVTSPTSRLGRVLFGLGCGTLVAFIRNFGTMPEGVCYSILIMNCLAPLIDKVVQPRVFGTRRRWPFIESKA